VLVTIHIPQMSTPLWMRRAIFSGTGRNIMNRRTILSIAAMTALGLALFPSGAVAQEGTLKQQLVGTWTLVSFDATPLNGTKVQPLGTNPKGVLMVEAGGRYAEVLGQPGRPKYKNLRQPTTEERAAAQGFFANFGTWSVSEADKTFIWRVEGTIIPNFEGADYKHSVGLAGDELKLSRVNPISDSRQDFVYRRAR
jgi:hypothetical protein